jgi:hypothetical protein
VRESQSLARLESQRIREVARSLRSLLARVRLPGDSGGVRPANLVWIFGAGRTGSTWLARMMGDLDGQTVWFEPRVGELFDPERMKVEERKGKPFILSSQYKSTWLRSIRNFVLDGANARFPRVREKDYLVIKEPGGSVGAPLLMQALPESRMVVLVRDPRDVAASWIDRYKRGEWKSHTEQLEETTPGRPKDWQVENMIKIAAGRYLQNVRGAKRAYDAHRGKKVLVRYEELREDPIGTMRRIYSELGIQVSDEELGRVVEKHSWESIPEDEKGEGKFFRKASPGGWRDDLTPEQIETVEKITAPMLEELYPDSAS